MACPRCKLRLERAIKRAPPSVPRKHAFHTSPNRQRLGAFTYAQEWQTGTYHFNKAHTKTMPVAAQRTDKLLTDWATQKRRVLGESAGYNLMLRNSITAQRRNTDRVFISKSTAKDFGDRIVVSAFVYDGEEATEQELERKRKARMGVKADGNGRRRKGPARRRAPGGAGGEGGGMRMGGASGAVRTPGARRLGGSGAPAAAIGFRRLKLTGAGSARGPARS